MCLSQEAQRTNLPFGLFQKRNLLIQPSSLDEHAVRVSVVRFEKHIDLTTGLVQKRSLLIRPSTRWAGGSCFSRPSRAR